MEIAHATGAPPVGPFASVCFEGGQGGVLTKYRTTAPMLSHPPPLEPSEAAILRGSIFTDLDRLTFALEMEAAARTSGTPGRSWRIARVVSMTRSEKTTHPRSSRKSR